MRIFLRTTLFTMLVVFSALIIWSLVRQRNITSSAQAASVLDVPDYCIPRELTGINELLAQPTDLAQEQDPISQQLLLAKKEDAEHAALKCAADATAHPPAKKPTNLVGVLRITPTSIPHPTETLQVGIQNSNSMAPPQSMFLPTKHINNTWQGIVQNNVVDVVAGSLNDENWQDHPDLPWQGAVFVWVSDSRKNGGQYSTPTRHGELHFIAACGTKLVLQATDGTTFVFDAATQVYVNNAPVCPTVTPW